MTRDAQRKLASVVMLAAACAAAAAGVYTGFLLERPYLGILPAAFAIQGLRGLLLAGLDPSLDGHDFVSDPTSALRLRFEQRRGRRGNVVELYDEKIVITSQALGNRHRFAVPYESLLRDPIAFTEPREAIPRWLFVTLALFGLLGLLLVVVNDDEAERRLYLLFVMGIGFLGFALWRLEVRPAVPLLQLSESDPALVLFADQPSPAAVGECVKAMRERKASYLAEHQGHVTSGPLVDTLERLFGLKQAGAITDEEYERLKAEALKTSVPANGERPGQYV
ncbi:MAG TPA: SHOCT domain-containing protein [Myxococcota bacterium]|nr:SHOCT domain-containing protein [Myxococcota bacterium]